MTETSFCFRFDHLIYEDSSKGFLIMSGTIEEDNEASRKAIKDNDGRRTVKVLATSALHPVCALYYDVKGEFRTGKYGSQFMATCLSLHEETTVSGVERFLASDLFPGIGDVAAKRIANTLGHDAIARLKSDPSLMDTVPRLSPKQRAVITKVLGEDEEKNTTLSALMDLGLSFPVARTLEETYGASSVEKVKENPYRLINEVPRFGFIRADKIALALGMAKTDTRRLTALVVYLLRLQLARTGDSYLLEEDLSEGVERELAKISESLDREDYRKIIARLCADKEIVIEEGGHVYLRQVWLAERLVSRRIGRMLREGKSIAIPSDFLPALASTEGIAYVPEQEKAILTALKEPLSIVTGGPGTGKTTIVKGIIAGYRRLGYKDREIALLAPTGRAAERLKELSNVKALTIHKALGYDGSTYAYDATVKIPFVKAVIVDECSMVDIVLFARLLSALADDCRLVLVGDRDQLPSVGSGDVLNDLIGCGEITTSVLTENHRQADGSRIVALANAVREGELPPAVFTAQDDYTFLPSSADEIPKVIEDVCRQAIAAGNSLQTDIQVLVPLYKGPSGIDAVNARLQEAFNPLARGHKGESEKLFPGDKVIQLVNRMDKGVMNGDIGIVMRVMPGEGTLVVSFGERAVSYGRDERDDLRLAYAVSIHKAQGSEFPVVIMPVTLRYFVMLRRKLLYTAITRASRKLIIIGEAEAFARGVGMLEEKRKSALSSLVSENLEHENETDAMLEENGDLTDAGLSPYDFLD